MTVTAHQTDPVTFVLIFRIPKAGCLYSEESGVTPYRFYRIGKDGRMANTPDVIKCADDEAAIKKAKLLALISPSIYGTWPAK